jgi:hypothetical protein
MINETEWAALHNKAKELGLDVATFEVYDISDEPGVEAVSAYLFNPKTGRAMGSAYTDVGRIESGVFTAFPDWA